MRIKLIEVPEVPKLSIMYNQYSELLTELDFEVHKNIPNTIACFRDDYVVAISFGNNLLPGYSFHKSLYNYFTPLDVMNFYDKELDIIRMPNIFRNLGENKYILDIRNPPSDIYGFMHCYTCGYYDTDYLSFGSNDLNVEINLDKEILILSENKSGLTGKSTVYTYYEDSNAILQNFLNGEHTITITIKEEVT